MKIYDCKYDDQIDAATYTINGKEGEPHGNGDNSHKIEAEPWWRDPSDHPTARISLRPTPRP
jgi:hypothetical protein